MSLVVATGLAAPAATAANLRQYAVAVIDANTGQVMHSRGADATRYPASIAKVMTLYILFEELDAGRMRLTTPMRVSSRAAAAQPSNLNLAAGQSITVEDAILALVTKSANDVARVIAEAISGSESKFAERMTATARSLGMSRTTYKNASGLPDSGQVTTVRDQARLGIAIYQHFPEYYRYFQTRSFRYRGQSYGNHNRLLGVNGIDGIKTGYISASGFNLLTAARSNNRHIVVAAFGFESGSARDARVKELVNKYLPEARRGDTLAQAMIPRPGGGAGSRANPVQVALLSPPPPRPDRFAPSIPVPIAPVELPGGEQIVLAAYQEDIPAPPDRPFAMAPASPPEAPLALMPVPIGGGNEPDFAPASILGNFLADMFGGRDPAAPAPPGLVPPAEIGGPLITGSAYAAPDARPAPGAWTVQVGAAPSEAGAYRLLQQAGANLAGLSVYQSYVQPITRDGQALYRARFFGFAGRSDASAMCEELKRQQISCLAMPG